MFRCTETKKPNILMTSSYIQTALCQKWLKTHFNTGVCSCSSVQSARRKRWWSGRNTSERKRTKDFSACSGEARKQPRFDSLSLSNVLMCSCLFIISIIQYKHTYPALKTALSHITAQKCPARDIKGPYPRKWFCPWSNRETETKTACLLVKKCGKIKLT